MATSAGKDPIPLRPLLWRALAAARTLALWVATLALLWTLRAPVLGIHPEDKGLGEAVADKSSFVTLLRPVNIDTVVIDGRYYSTRAPAMGWMLGLLQRAGLSEVAAMRTFQLAGAASLLVVLTPLIGVTWAIIVLLSPPMVAWATADCGTPLWVASFILLGTTAVSPWLAGGALGLLPLWDFRVLPAVVLAPLSGWRAGLAALPGVLGLAAYNWVTTGAPWDFVIWHSQHFPWTRDQFFWFSPWQGFTAVWAQADLNDPIRNAIGEQWPGFATVAPWVLLLPFAVRARVWRYPAPWVILGLILLLLTHRTTIPRYLVPLIPFWIVAATHPEHIAAGRKTWLTMLRFGRTSRPGTS